VGAPVDGDAVGVIVLGAIVVGAPVDGDAVGAIVLGAIVVGVAVGAVGAMVGHVPPRAVPSALGRVV